MNAVLTALRDDNATLKAALAVAQERAASVTAELAVERADRSADRALIAHLKLEIMKLNRARFGPETL